MKIYVFLFLILFPAILFSDTAVQSINVQKDQDAYLVIFKSEGKANLIYSSSILADPPRIVFDFPGMESELGTHVMDWKENPLISQIKTGDKLEPGKKSFHVEIDLRKPVDFSLNPASSGFAIRLTPKVEKHIDTSSLQNDSATKPATSAAKPVTPAAKPASTAIKPPTPAAKPATPVPPPGEAPALKPSSSPPPSNAKVSNDKSDKKDKKEKKDKKDKHEQEAKVSKDKKDSSGSGSTPAPIAPANSRATPTISAPPTTQPPVPPGEPRLDIGAEDLLEVTVFELPQFNTTTRVSGDGEITMPLIGSIKVGGLTRQEAESKIRQALNEKYVNDANVSVNIKEYKSKQIAVFGAVKNPGALYLLGRRNLLQVITDVGGLTPDASPKCFIVRADGSRIEIDLAELMNTGDPKWNVPVYPGDFINIPTGGKIVIYVLGEVRNPGPVDITFGTPMTVLTAIAKAGGLTANAGKGIQIRRKKADGQIAVLKVNLKDILKGKKPDMNLEPGDVINVPESFF